MGMVALSNLVSTSLQAATPPEMVGTKGALPQLHFKPKAKRVIFLFMNGGVSHVDTFDHKPMLDKYNGQPTPGGSVVTQRKTGNLMMSPFKFKKYGDSGLEISELWPHVGGIADEICMINSLYAEIPNHEPCLTMMNTGSNIIGRPLFIFWSQDVPPSSETAPTIGERIGNFFYSVRHFFDKTRWGRTFHIVR